MWKLRFHNAKVSNLHKIGKYGKEIAENYQPNREKLVSIETVSAPVDNFGEESNKDFPCEIIKCN